MGVRLGGRAKGTPNKRTLDAAERLKSYQDPLVFMAEVMEDEQVPVEHRMSAARELASYLYPKRKALEISGDGGAEIAGSIKVSFVPAKASA